MSKSPIREWATSTYNSASSRYVLVPTAIQIMQHDRHCSVANPDSQQDITQAHSSAPFNIAASGVILRVRYPSFCFFTPLD
ncbi:hypothetical protein FPOAC1_001057 [Fusarium poae]|uniref:hypothetical protein n=1 Tax=Fusarium poae TaxID=36050 RepID=UPI001CE78461|nr:hypothetical protein FPOAC1_001057 [Fusarium poae]KAG8675080.1 hypothetical protein FPOAC1_001057 [Fusarium poae]